MEEEKALELFDFFNKEGYDVGDIDTFKGGLSDPEKAAELHSFFEKEGYDVGDITNFNLKKKESSELSTEVETDTVVSQETTKEDSVSQEPQSDVIPPLGKLANEAVARGEFDNIDTTLQDETDLLLDNYRESVSSTDVDIEAATTIAEEEKQGEYGFFDKIKRLYSSASLSNVSLPNFLYTDPNLQKQIDITKEIADEQKIGINDVSQEEVKNRVKEQRIDEELLSIKNKKTEEFIETLSEDQQTKIKNRLSIESGTLSSESISKLMTAEGIKKEIDAVAEQLKTINDAHDSNNIYSDEYYANNTALGTKANELISQLDSSLDEFADINKDLGSTDNELDLFKRNYGDLTNFTNKLGIATGELGLNLAFLLNKAQVNNPQSFILGNELEQHIIQAKQNLDKERNLLRRGKSVSEIDGAEDLVEWAMDLVAEQIPNTVLMASTGGTSALATLGTASAGGKLFELERQEREEGAEFTDLQKYGGSFLTGLAEAASEKISFGQINKAKRVLGTISRKELKDNTLKYLKKTFASNGTIQFVKDITAEGTSEAMSQLAENMTDRYLLGKDIDLTEGLTDAFVSGAFMSGMIFKMPVIAKNLREPFTSKDTNQKLGERQSEIENLTKQLENGLNVEAEKAVSDQRDELVLKNKALLNKSINDFDKLSQEDVTDLLDIEHEKFVLRKQAKAIREEPKMDDSARQVSIKKIDEDIKELEVEKEEIIDGSVNAPNIDDVTSVIDELFEDFDKLSKEDTPEAKDKLQEVEKQINTAVELRDELNAGIVASIPDTTKEQATKEFGESGTQEQINERAIELQKEAKAKEKIAIDKVTDVNIAKTIGLDTLVKNLDKLEDNLNEFTKNTLGSNVPVAVAKASLVAMKLAVKTAKTTADVVSAGMNAIRKSDWFKKLSAGEKGKVEANFVKQASEGFTDLKKLIIDSSTILTELDIAEKEVKESRRKLKSFKTRIKNREEAAKAAVAFVKKATSPKEFEKLKKGEFNKIVQEIRDVKTEAGLAKLIKKVTDIVDDAVVREMNVKFDKLLRSKKVGANKQALIDEFGVDVINLLTKGNFLDKTYTELDNIENSTNDEAVLTAVSIARQKQKSDKARRKDMSRLHIETAVEELDTAIKKGRSNISKLRAIHQAEKENRLEQARTETSRKTKEERDILNEHESIRTSQSKDLDELLTRAIELINKIKKSYPAMNVEDALNELDNVNSKSDIDNLLQEVINEYSDRADFKSREKRAVSFGRAMVDALTKVSFDIATIVSFISKKGADSMLGGFLHETITNQVRRSAYKVIDTRQENLQKVNDKITSIYKSAYPKYVKDIGDLVDSVLEDTNVQIPTGVFHKGNEITLSRGELMWLYNQNKNSDSKKHFDAKGITPELLDQWVTENLTKEDIEFADWLVDEFYPEAYPAINAVYKKIHFRNMPISQFYAGSLQFEGNENIETKLTGEEGWEKKATAMFFGSGIERINHRHPISTHTNALTNMMNYVGESSKFVASAEAFRDVMEILNDSEVSDNLAKYTSKRVHSNLKRAVEFAFGAKTEKTSGIITFLIQAKILVSLGFSPKLMVTQLMSTSLWLTESPSDIIKNIHNTANPKLLREILQNSASMRERYGISKGDVSVKAFVKGSDMAKLEASYIASRSKVMNRFRGMRIAGKGKDNLFKLALSFIKMGDASGMFVLGVPFYAAAKKEGLAKFNGDEKKAIAYAVDKFEATASKTQQSYSAHDRDLIQLETVGKVFNMYANSPKQYFRNSIQALLELSRQVRGREVKGTIPQNTRKFILNHVVQGVLYQWIGTTMLGLLSDDDEDKTKLEDILFKGALMGSFSKFFIIGDIIEALYDSYQGRNFGANLGVPMLSTFEDIGRELIKLDAAQAKNDDVAIQESLTKMAKSVAEIAGIPVKKSEALFKNLDKVMNESDTMSTKELVARLLNYSDYALDNLTKEAKVQAEKIKQDKTKATKKRRAKKNVKNTRKRKKL